MIIDGVTSDVATLATIYPADIESFTVLKNASETALYGSRGASGVIQVKTKKGTGKGFQISYEGNYSIEAMYKRYQFPQGDYPNRKYPEPLSGLQRWHSAEQLPRFFWLYRP
ncbi:Outer membrane cobalamin receptor protein [Segatella copri]|nr:Outer membrane cobalamin receptor protein [Segatella copri]